MKPKFEKIVNRVIDSASPDKGERFYSGLATRSFESAKTISRLLALCESNAA